MSATPFYRLKTLINEKYGPNGFEKGCKIVAMFINHETKAALDAGDIKALCEADNTNTITITDAMYGALKSLFALKSADELFTNSETANFKKA